MQVLTFQYAFIIIIYTNYNYIKCSRQHGDYNHYELQTVDSRAMFSLESVRLCVCSLGLHGSIHMSVQSLTLSIHRAGNELVLAIHAVISLHNACHSGLKIVLQKKTD